MFLEQDSGRERIKELIMIKKGKEEQNKASFKSRTDFNIMFFNKFNNFI